MQEALTKGSDKTIADAWFGITTPNAATTALEPGQKIALTGTDQEKGILNRDLPLYRLVSLKNPGVTVVNNSMQKIAQAIKSGASVVDVDFNFSNGVVVPESLAVKAKFQQQALLIQPKAANAAQNLQKNAQSPRPRSPVAITGPKQITQDSLQSPQVLTKVGLSKNQTNTNSKPENIGQANEVVGDGVVKTTTNFSGNPNDDSGGADSKNGSPRSPGDALTSKSKSGSMKDSQRLQAERELEQKQALLQQFLATSPADKNNSSLSQKNSSMSPNPDKPATPRKTPDPSRQASNRDQDEEANPAPAYGSKKSLKELSKSSSGSGSFKTAEGESSSRSSQSRRLSSSKT